MLITLELTRQDDGGVRVDAKADAPMWSHIVSARDFEATQRAAAVLMEGFESGHRPLADPVGLQAVGRDLQTTFLPELKTDQPDVRLLFRSSNPELLNLPWELLTGPDGSFLAANHRWSMRRTTSESLSANRAQPAAGPLRVLFTAAAPAGLAGLDYEREEEAMMRIADRLGSRVHLEIAEAGSFDELSDLISEYRPHVVHLSGHGVLRDGVGTFAFEDERGALDSRPGSEMAERLFSGDGVRLVFVSGCQSAQAGVAGVCQSLTALGNVPLAIGWGASVADDLATEFARCLYHGLAVGRPVEQAVAKARVDLLRRGRGKLSDGEVLDATFALPQIYAGSDLEALVDDTLELVPPRVSRVSYELLGDNIRGLREGFVGRRRALQRLGPALRNGEKHIVLLTGIGGVGKSTLATRLGNRMQRSGFRVVALQARRDATDSFCLRLLSELATACQRLGRETDESLLLNGKRPVEQRLRLAVEILREAKILLVLDNLEDLMPPPPGPPEWMDPDFAGFIRDLTSRLTRAGRVVLTSRYIPSGFPVDELQVVHEPLPDFTEADFFKFLRRIPRVAERIERNELPRDILVEFQRKLGATPRFIAQAGAVLERIDPDDLREQLTRVAEPGAGLDKGELAGLQQDYFQQLFLPQLYDALSRESKTALSRLAVVELPLPLDAIEAVCDVTDSGDFTEQWMSLGLAQRFGEEKQTPLFGIYPLQREFLGSQERLLEDERKAAHRAAAAFLQACYEGDREEELRLPVGVELEACLYHARAAGDRERERWAAVRIARGMQGRAEFRAVLELIEPLLRIDRDPECLGQAAQALVSLGEWGKARKHYEECILQFQRTGDRASEATTWHQLATIDLREGNYENARANFKKALEMRQIGNRASEAATCHNLATIDVHEGNYENARTNFKKALEMLQAIGNRVGEAATWHNLATIDLREGNYENARTNFKKALEMLQAIEDRPGEAATWHNLASIDLREGNYENARSNFKKALEMRQAIGDRAGEASTWHGWATIDLREGNYENARSNFKKALEMRQAIGDRPGEAATFAQLGNLGYVLKQILPAALLMSVSHDLLFAIGAADQKVVWNKLCALAGQLKLDQAEFEALQCVAARSYQQDRGAQLIAEAFQNIE